MSYLENVRVFTAWWGKRLGCLQLEATDLEMMDPLEVCPWIPLSQVRVKKDLVPSDTGQLFVAGPPIGKLCATLQCPCRK